MGSTKRFYDDSLYRFDTPQPSYWESSVDHSDDNRAPLQADDSCDIAIIGGGYTGLSAAMQLSGEYQCDVRVLDAGHIGWGASGRNGGFCALGGVKLSHKQMLSRFGLEAVRDFWQSQATAVELVTEICSDEGIDVDRQGDGEYTVASSKKNYDYLCEEATLWNKSFGLYASTLSREEFLEVGYDSTEQQGAMMLKPGYGLHPLRYARGLARAAERHGAVLHPYSEVTHWHKVGGWHHLKTANATLKAKQVLVACNGFMPEHLDERFKSRLVPVQSNIIVTRELSKSELELHGWRTDCPLLNTRNLFFYYRMLSGHRLMVGARGGTMGSEAEAARMFDSMKVRVNDIWPAWQHVDIEYAWRGLIGINSTRCPALGRLSDDSSVFFAFGYQGNGVNTATWSGRQMANWIAGEERLYGRGKAIPKIMLSGSGGGLPQKIRPAVFRRSYLKAMLLQYRLLDRLNVWH